jgi:glyoxylase-like metal-dependent hydrolase (beta-lactamase superfamily II)
MNQPNPDKDVSPLASVVNAGESQTDAIPITDFIFMSQDVSNSYLVTTPAGDVLVNCGTVRGGPRHKALFSKVSNHPINYAIITQSHPDHFGGLAAQRSPETKTIVQARFFENREVWIGLASYFHPRSAKLWSSVMPTWGGGPPEEVVPDIYVQDFYAFELGGRKFEILHTPEGETPDSVTVWMPNERIAFTGNLFGPMFMAMPFLCTLRGDRPRSVLQYLRSLERVRKLEPELLITGHGGPIVGAKQIQKDLTTLRDAVTYVKDQTIAGMNAGKDVHTLMREIKLPPHLTIGEWHGKVSWCVRDIWQEHSGWFYYESTTELYGIPRSSVSDDLVELIGADVLAGRARHRLQSGQPLEALHLLEIVLKVQPKHRQSLELKRDAHMRLLEESGSVNHSETMWLKSEIAAANAALG